MAKATTVKTSEDVYRYWVGKKEHIVNREYGVSPQGNPYNGHWVIRVRQTGEYVDHDQFINDLAERHSFDHLSC